MDNKKLSQILNNLVIFRNLRSQPLISSLAALLNASNADESGTLFLDVAAALYPYGSNIKEAVLNLILRDDNIIVDLYSKDKKPDSNIESWLTKELDALEAAAKSSAELANTLGIDSSIIPSWNSTDISYRDKYAEMLNNAHTDGFGIFSQFSVFSVSDKGELTTIDNPDPQNIDTLYCYEIEKNKVIKNTEALLAGKSANNILLYGDAGTGKSSLVKAMVNKYHKNGLRLIQVDKDKLHYIPALMDKLSDNPLKFVLFIDDLSFTTNDSNFTALKTILEGSVSARPENIVVYATSNRRHLVKESFQAREGDEVHLNDTLEEVASLSARFGIVITFGRPDKDKYVYIVKQLAESYGYKYQDEQSLINSAEAYAIRAGGRTPRVAKQFIEYTIAMDL